RSLPIEPPAGGIPKVHPNTPGILAKNLHHRLMSIRWLHRAILLDEEVLMKVVSSLLLLLAPVLASADDKASPVGKKIDNFKLHDYRGAERSLAEFADKKAVVVAFVGCGCPVSRLYGLRLDELAREYEPKGVAFLAVNSNQHDSIRDI